ncbi:hypothetical protein [Dermatobacter hominis]|uniref:hypothetical protein n=1 Tax=Dermatobacter hominis TaxID=2884263 RepID=UPI001D0F4C31|nr:hypothetical protein [Dermatobacter hominis]UDY35674.1 hypothetical protein LH044_20405 [Dermatobacter hominis]
MSARTPRRSRTRTVAAVLGATVALLPLAACGDDEKADSTTTTEATAATASVEGFCEQAFTTDAAVNAANSSAGEQGPDEAAVEKAKTELTALEEAAPAEAEATATAVVDATEAMFTNPGPPSDEFLSSFADLVDWMADNCDYQVIDVEAHEYAFEGLPETAKPGRTIVRLTNHGNEVHEIAFAKAKDGVTESAEELIQLPEEQAGEKVEFLSSGFAMPGGSGGALLDTTDGRYIAVCFIPTGMTPAAMEQMMTSGAEPEGMPHAMQGMVGEFTVG